MAERNLNKEIYVYADWQGRRDPELLGILTSQFSRGVEVFSFEYTTNRSKPGSNQSLDPDIQFFQGKQYVTGDKPNFGMFLDAAPGSWARRLHTQYEEINATREQRPARELTESDYLLRACDEYRMGGLRFRTDDHSAFLSPNPGPMVSIDHIAELENISLLLEKNEHPAAGQLNCLDALYQSGGALGGSRPKACVRDDQGNFWIAKFRSATDTTDVAAWAMVAQQLAFFAGLSVPPAMVKNPSGNGNTFLSRRFDRADSRRLHYASAQTLTGHYSSGDKRAGSYLEMVAFMLQHGARVNKCLEELWRRVVFNILTKNTDDHLRNHAFILTRNGWELSPAFDVNPNPAGKGLTLNISETDNSLSLDLAMEVAPYFRLKEKQAVKILDKVKGAVKNWRSVATRYKIPKAEQDKMAEAFGES